MNSAPQKQSYGESLKALFREFDAEPFGQLLEREKGSFDRLAHPYEREIVLFGAGPLGRVVLDGLRRAGLNPIAFSDNNESLWGTHLNGLEVLAPEQVARQYGERACFVVTIFNGASVRKQLSDLGCRRVLHFAPLFWKYDSVFVPHNGIDLPHRLREQANEIESCFSVLADEDSKTEFCQQLRSRYFLDFDCLPPALDGGNIYFPDDLISPLDEEVFVDCGAFNGDSVRSFLRHRENRFGHIFPIEPDPSNRQALSKFVGERKELNGRVTVLPYAVANENSRLRFNVTSTAGSSLSNESSFEVESRRLDDIEWEHAPTYIKMDIEGAEPEALMGATKLLRRNLPVLAICLYHRSDHLWKISNLIRSISSEYSLFIRRYAEECWELVCYAVPRNRLNTQKP